MDVYQRPYDSEFPVVCMDESPKQLIGEVRAPIPMRPGQIRKIDDEYERKGTAEIFLAVEPLTGKMNASVQNHRTKCDWAYFIKDLIDNKYPDAQKIVLVIDNLNTHKMASFYETFEPEEAHRLASKLQVHYTPKHGSWLNIAEIGFSLLKRLCIPQRIATIEELRTKIKDFLDERNRQNIKVNWHFKTVDAREKLRHLYPNL